MWWRIIFPRFQLSRKIDRSKGAPSPTPQKGADLEMGQWLQEATVSGKTFLFLPEKLLDHSL